MLGHKALRVHDPDRHVVAKLALERSTDDAEGVAAVVRHQVLHVFQEECWRPVRRDDPGDVEEQSALGLAKEAVRAAQSVLLRYTCYREGLAREPGEKHVVFGDIGGSDLCDVARDLLFTEVGEVRRPRPLVPLAAEDASPACLLEAEAHAAYAGEEVDEAEIGHDMIMPQAKDACRPR